MQVFHLNELEFRFVKFRGDAGIDRRKLSVQIQNPASRLIPLALEDPVLASGNGMQIPFCAWDENGATGATSRAPITSTFRIAPRAAWI